MRISSMPARYSVRDLLRSAVVRSPTRANAASMPSSRDSRELEKRFGARFKPDAGWSQVRTNP
ncbi:MAG: hypothetical protein QM747_13405 [Nocardioides sp.]